MMARLMPTACAMSSICASRTPRSSNSRRVAARISCLRAARRSEVGMCQRMPATASGTFCRVPHVFWVDMRPLSELQRQVAPFEVVSDYEPAGDQPAAIAELEQAHERRRPGRRADGCHRHRQDGHHRLAGRTPAASDAGDAAQQDAGGPVRQRAARAAAPQRGRVLRLLLRLLPTRGVRPADRHLHREGLLGQRGGRAAAALAPPGRCSPGATSSSSPACRASTASARRRSTSTA